ncbi:unnamed protein product [Oppiella nova]|uniref:Spermatogenesis-associated protein 6 N-terminal domain-containing protein n=1 Tax=Oppiella nova TaxID=334625 RepID=A0A7R9M7U4_9ACAR|nr:unnamed protein product [Oppiella nova]CAG2172240.1 unnamed protein product [Oppiella nova]
MPYSVDFILLKLSGELPVMISCPDEQIVIELTDDKNFIICKYESNAHNFLYPRPQLRPKYSQSSRSLLMDSCLLPIAPKLEFQIINSITQEVNECDTDKDIDTYESESVESHPESEDNSLTF